MAVVLGLVIASSFGTADFLGGRASRQASATGVLLAAQVIAASGAALVALAAGGSAGGRDVLLGLAAGACNVVGLGLLYRGLADGRMGVVAPITAVVGAAVPIAWGILDGERPSATTWTGIAIAVGAAALIAREPDPSGAPARPTRRPAVMAVVAGAALGASFVCFDATGSGAGFWPVLAARVVTLVLVAAAAVVLARRASFVMPAGADRRMALAAGAFDVTAMAVLLEAVRDELAVVVAPVAALAPAFTVVLAWWLLDEPAAPLQRAGIVAALAGLSLIAAG